MIFRPLIRNTYWKKTQTDMLGVWTLPDKGTRAHVARSDKRQVRSTGVAVAGFVKDKASGP